MWNKNALVATTKYEKDSQLQCQSDASRWNSINTVATCIETSLSPFIDPHSTAE